MMEWLRKIVRSRYVHLLLGLLVLYGISWVLTYSTRFEKILESLRWYCYADYRAMAMSSKKSVDAGRLYREGYGERLDSLTSGLFDWRDEDQAKEFFMRKEYVYQVRDEGKRFRSYLLAPVIGKGTHTTEIPQHVTFYYYMLGYKEIPTFLEYLDKKNTSCLFVSAANRVVYAHPEIYIHADSLVPILKWYFEFLWETQPQSSENFYIAGDPKTNFLYRDLKGVCEDVFAKPVRRDKNEAKNYFTNEGLEAFLPTLLAMGAAMALDQDSVSQPGDRYLRALFTGLSFEPNYTMFYLSCRYQHCDPAVNKIMEEFKGRVGANPDWVTRDKISQAAQEMLKKLGGSKGYNNSWSE